MFFKAILKSITAIMLGLVATGSQAAVTYFYDGAGRLLSVGYGDGSALVYVYDNRGNILSEALDVDSDNDGIPDSVDPDDDNDGMPDTFENDNGLNRLDPADAALDKDMDGLTNLQEYQIGTNPGNPDTDGDGKSDADEFNAGSNPLVNEGAALLPIFQIIIDD